MLKWTTEEQRRDFESIEFEYITFSWFEKRIKGFLETQDESVTQFSQMKGKHVKQWDRDRDQIRSKIGRNANDVDYSTLITYKSRENRENFKRKRMLEQRRQFYSVLGRTGFSQKNMPTESEVARPREGRQWRLPEIVETVDKKNATKQRVALHTADTIKLFASRHPEQSSHFQVEANELPFLIRKQVNRLLLLSKLIRMLEKEISFYN